jgi:formylmethanofuran dehydrogenase subunit B
VRVAVPRDGLVAEPLDTVIVIASSLVAAFPSVAVTVTLKVPSSVGDPEITPDDVVKLIPEGSVPVIEYETVVRPPETANDVL